MSEDPESVVLDSSAVLAFILGERGGSAVGRWLSSGKLSVVNYAEVLTRLTSGSMPVQDAALSVSALGLGIVPFTIEQARHSAEMRPLTRAAGLSLGDRACLALAHDLGMPALTADRQWAQVAAQIGIDIMLIR